MTEQKQFLDVIDRDEAERRFHAALQLLPLSSERISLNEALGRVLATDVTAAVDVPSFDRSNLDGFAVQASDTFDAEEERPAILRLLAESIATAVTPQMEVMPGTAMSIATGGMMPRGADAIVMIEHADVSGDESTGFQVSVRKSSSLGRGVSFAASDITSGETVLYRGDSLTSRETGVLAAIGVAEIEVWRRPRIGVISTGDEIIAPGEPMRPGMIYDSNARILSDAITELGGEPVSLGIVRDDLDELRKRLSEALNTCDMVLLSGGTSKGEGDLCYHAVRELTEPGIVAHGVALKPGKPICLAATKGKPVIILPGFPTSAIFTFHEFAAPVIRKLGGREAPPRDIRRAELAVKVNSEIGRTEYLLVGLAAGNEDSNSALVAYPMGKGSGSVTTFSRADGFVTISRHQEIMEAGEVVDVRLLSHDLPLADLVVIGSHCVGLDLLLGLLREQGFRSKLMQVGSTAGLEAVRRGECDIAGIHLYDSKTGKFNTPFLTDTMRLLPGYRRQQGLVMRADDPLIEGVNVTEFGAGAMIEVLQSKPNYRMVNRNQGSGTRILIDRLLVGTKPPGYPMQARNHNAVAAAIRQRRADWGVAIANVATASDLIFAPIEEEHYDFVTPNSKQDRPAVQAFEKLLKSEDVRRQLAKLGFGFEG